jgi:hypothetical protein
MTLTSGDKPLRHSPWPWLHPVALFLSAGLLGATWLAGVAGFPHPYSDPDICVRTLCGLAIALVTLIVVQFPDRASPA